MGQCEKRGAEIIRAVALLLGVGIVAFPYTYFFSSSLYCNKGNTPIFRMARIVLARKLIGK